MVVEQGGVCIENATVEVEALMEDANTGAVMVRAKPRRWSRFFLICAAVVTGIPLVLIVVGAIADTLNPSWRNTHVGRECKLTGTTAIVPYSSAEHPGELLVTNRDGETWNDAQLSIDGEIVTGPNKGTRTGVHRLTRDVRPGLNTIPLADFQTKDGIRWAPSTMRADGLGVTASLRTEKCQFEHTFR
jgi:hypothetical protein